MKRLSLLLTAVVSTIALFGLSACSSGDESADKDASATTVDQASDGDTSADDDGATSQEVTDDDDGDDKASDVASSPVDGALVDRVVASMTAGDDSMLTEDQARCYAEANIRIIGADRIEESLDHAENAPRDADGFLDLNVFDFSDIAMTRAEAGEVYDAADGCGLDFRTLMLESMEDSGMPASAKDCVEKVVTDDSVRTLMIAIMTDGPAAMMSGAGMEFSRGLMACDPEVGGA